MSHLSWSIIVELLPIKDETKRIYYTNLCLENSLSVRELRTEIKSNSYERLIDKPEHIEIISAKNNNSITTNMKNPIVLYLDKNEQVKESFHNKTIGIIITKEQEEFIANFVNSENIIPLVYELK